MSTNTVGTRFAFRAAVTPHNSRYKLQAIKRAARPRIVLPKDMRIDLSNFHIIVTKEILDRTDISGAGEHMGGERMPERMTDNPLILDTSERHGLFKYFSDDGRV